MASYQLTEITCDGPAPGVDCPDSAGLTHIGSAAGVRVWLSDEQGWTSKRRKWQYGVRALVDQCPRCAAAEPPGVA